MYQGSEGVRSAAALTSNASQQTGCYVYCIAPGRGWDVRLGATGIDGHDVHPVAHADLCALVHHSPPHPYQSPEPGVVASWVMAHHQVVDAAWKLLGTVLPLAFNTIVKEEQQGCEHSNVRAWLETNRHALEAKLEALRGKAEYGVQAFWEPALVGRRMAAESAGIRKLEDEAQSAPRGLAYMYRQRLELALRREMEARTQEELRTLCSNISLVADRIRVEKTKAVEGQPTMLLNITCLLSQERYKELEAELERASVREKMLVRLVGPMPPYSFC